MPDPKRPMPSTADATPPPGTTTQSALEQKRIAEIRAKHYRIVAQRNAQLVKLQATSAERWIQRVKQLQRDDPGYLKYLQKTYPKQVAEAERAIAAGKVASTPKVVGPRIGSPKIGGFRAGFKAGLAGAFSPLNLAALAAEIILAVADREAAKEAIRNIQTKYLREGFARGFAAGVMGWTDEEVQLNLKYHVRV